MTPANTLRLAGLAERAERIGCVLTDPGAIPEGLYTAEGRYLDICPIFPEEMDQNDDDAIDQFVEFALESDSIMLDATEFEIDRLEREGSRAFRRNIWGIGWAAVVRERAAQAIYREERKASEWFDIGGESGEGASE